MRAVAGTHVVSLGLNLTSAARKGCLGFAIRRTDHSEGEGYWMRGFKTFRSVLPSLAAGTTVSSRAHPFQMFQWADYTAKPGHRYTFEVIALRGAPAALVEGPSVTIPIRTEPEWDGPHSVFFNRGAVSSQAYAQRFGNADPAKVGEAAWAWLSRGLVEALQTFITRAKDKSFGLYGAVYEFQEDEPLEALRAARKVAQVRIRFDGIKNGPGPKNVAAITKHGLGQVCRPVTNGKIMHNKFFVLTKDDVPVAVWTGSTNLTENGIYGHSNCGHVVEDESVAGAFLRYWKELADDPELPALRAWNAGENPNPPATWKKGTSVVFSPRSAADGEAVLGALADLAGRAGSALFMTFAFGMNAKFKTVYETKDDVLRVALMEKEGNGAQLAQGRKDIARIRKRGNVIVAVASNLRLNSFDRWVAERAKLTAEANVKWIHTKYMLVDPLSDDPIVVTGSANFSKASMDANHENLLVIRGNRRVADIYLTEFMRLYNHYAFREAVAFARKNKEKTWKPQYLAEDASWQEQHYEPGTSRYLRRSYFS